MLVVWGIVTFVAAIIPLKLSTARGLMLGFTFAICGAVVITADIAAGNLSAKKQLIEVEAQLSDLKASTPVDEKRTPAQAPTPPKNAASLKNERERLLGKIELAGLLTTFTAMTLGGLGGGLLTAAVSMPRNRQEEERQEKPLLERILNGYFYLFAFVLTSSLILLAGAYTFIARQLTNAGTAHPLLLVPIVGFLLSIVFSGIAFDRTRSHLKKDKPQLLLQSIIGLFALFFYLNTVAHVWYDIGAISMALHIPVVLALSLHALYRYRQTARR
ncbi:hypothetical protein [Pseudomonas guariconensis]|uniref:hypothetical protein n=1 Tax=Pseudomonas guariconensis TaxID=1288410 RepID=UPI002B05692F|nr:hypothetical protein [Pseudomonas guariconensis]